MVEHVEEPKRFAPKVPVQLDPPKYDPISYEELAKCDGMSLYKSLSKEPDKLLLTSHRGLRHGF